MAEEHNEKRWACSWCSFWNSPLIKECEMCGTVRGDTVGGYYSSLQKLAEQKMQNDGEAGGRGGAHGGPREVCSDMIPRVEPELRLRLRVQLADGEWQCKVCSFPNKASAGKCALCYQDRLASANVRNCIC